jgi:hypothetical protein
MSCQDLIVVSDQDGIGETEFLYARRDLGQLFARVPTGIPLERAQFR